MSQHDFDFTTADGNTGPTFRAGMNAMAQALATCSSGATEPSTMYAYQFWADTTSGYMKQRNAANNAWLTKWQLSAGQLAALAGATFTGLVNLAAGANIASAATIDLTAATGNSPRITGTTPTSAVTMNAGQKMTVVADGAWPLTYNATTNKINTGGKDYTCTAGDNILFRKDLSGVVHGIIFPVGGEAASQNIYKITQTGVDADALTGVMPHGLTAYYEGLRISLVPYGTNTISNPTINLSGVGTVTVKKRSIIGTISALQPGDWNSTGPFDFQYVGTDFILLNPLAAEAKFLAHLSATQSNVTGDGTAYTLICNTEIFDVGLTYNNATGVCTAPRTRKYRFNVHVAIEGLVPGTDIPDIQLVTSNRTFICQENKASSATQVFKIDTMADMDIGDTAYIVVRVQGGTKISDVTGHATILYTWFCGEEL